MPSTPAAEDRAVRRARLVVEAGLFDAEFYAAVRGRAFDDVHAAAEDLVRWGMPRRLSPHPFLDFASMPPEVRWAWRNGRVRVVLAYLTSEQGLARPYGPLFDPRTLPEGAAEGGPNPLASFLRTSTEQTPMPVPSDHRGPVPTRGEAEEALRAVARDLAGCAWDGDPAPAPPVRWREVRESVASRVPGRVSVVIPTYRDSAMTIRAVGAVLDRSDSFDVEVIVVDNGSPPHVGLALRAAFLGTPQVSCLRLPTNANFAGGSNAGFAASTGEVVVFLNNDTHVRRGWLAPLVRALEEPDVAGAQSLLLYEDDTIQTAGTVFLRADLLPAHLLVDHPKEDALGVAGRRFSAITGAVMALRAVDVVELQGFDTAYVNGFEDVDLCLRALRRRPGGFRVVPDSLVTHYESRTPGRYDRVMDNRRLFRARWAAHYPPLDEDLHERLGFRLEPLEDDGQPVPAAVPRVGGLVRTAPDRLRWAIKLPSTPGHWGDDWGDTHFAEALGRSLRELGQDAVTCRYGAHHGPAGLLDDVSLGIRGSHPVAPSPGRTNVLWVISHPDEVEAGELDGFDLVFAASEPWAAAMTRRSGRLVTPLLQATEVVPLDPPQRLDGAAREAVFVGSTHENRHRRLVLQAVESGIPLAVHGRGWEELPPGIWRSRYVPNEDLPGLYRAHGIVLADHWPDMARQGFIANRVFDAVAAGAGVISDPVLGLGDVFGGEVAVCRSPEEIRDAFSRLARPGPADALAAHRVSQTHSFTARAATLMAAVSAELSQR